MYTLTNCILNWFNKTHILKQAEQSKEYAKVMISNITERLRWKCVGKKKIKKKEKGELRGSPALIFNQNV